MFALATHAFRRSPHQQLSRPVLYLVTAGVAIRFTWWATADTKPPKRKTQHQESHELSDGYTSFWNLVATPAKIISLVGLGGINSRHLLSPEASTTISSTQASQDQELTGKRGTSHTCRGHDASSSPERVFSREEDSPNTPERETELQETDAESKHYLAAAERRQLFSGLAWRYDSAMTWTHRRVRRGHVGLIRDYAHGDVLEVACGTGIFAKNYLENGRKQESSSKLKHDHVEGVDDGRNGQGASDMRGGRAIMRGISSVTMVDSCREMLERAHLRIHQLFINQASTSTTGNEQELDSSSFILRKASTERLPFADNSFDTLSLIVLSYLLGRQIS